MTVAASHISSLCIISWNVTWDLLNFNDCCYHFKTTAWKLCSVSYSKLKTCLLGNCIEKETIHSILKTSEARLRSEAWGSLPQSWGLRTFSLSYARDKTKRHLSLFLYWAQNLPSHLFYFKTVYILHNMDLRRMLLKILWGHFVSTSSTARKTIETILMKLLRYRNDSNNWFRVD